MAGMESLTDGNFRRNSFHKIIHGNGTRILPDATAHEHPVADGFERADHKHGGDFLELGITNLRSNVSRFSSAVTQILCLLLSGG